jgi:hypothetical protein
MAFDPRYLWDLPQLELLWEMREWTEGRIAGRLGKSFNNNNRTMEIRNSQSSQLPLSKAGRTSQHWALSQELFGNNL